MTITVTRTWKSDGAQVALSLDDALDTLAAHALDRQPRESPSTRRARLRRAILLGERVETKTAVFRLRASWAK